jgi:lipid-A-disaccharide synthase
MLPIMADAAGLLAQRHPQLQFILPQADSVSDALLQQYLPTTRPAIRIVKQQPYDAIQCCDAIMTTSGTASLEIALLQIPLVIAYRLSPLSYWIGKQLVNIPFIGLPNIIAGRAVAQELIQHAVTAEALAAEIEQLLFNHAHRTACLQGLAEVKHQLGSGGGSQRMAALALELLQTPT